MPDCMDALRNRQVLVLSVDGLTRRSMVRIAPITSHVA